MAIAARGGDKAVAGVITHADRGTQGRNRDQPVVDGMRTTLERVKAAAEAG